MQLARKTLRRFTPCRIMGDTPDNLIQRAPPAYEKPAPHTQNSRKYRYAPRVAPGARRPPFLTRAVLGK